MRLAIALALLAACSKPSPTNVRFVVEVDARFVDDVEISIGGKPVTLDPVKPNISTVSGFVDFPVAEISADARPTIKLRSPCGERTLADTEYETRPPNEQNVVQFRVVERLFPKPSFVAAIDPTAPAVKLGSYAVPASRPEVLRMFGACAFQVTVGDQAVDVPAPTGGQRTLVVAASPTACLNEGVVVYAAPGAACARDWNELHRNQLAFWSKVYPSVLWKDALAASVTKRGGGKCLERGFVARC